MLNLTDSERQTLSSFMMFSMTQRQTLLSCVKLRLTQRQTLSYCTMMLVMTQRGKLCYLVWSWGGHRDKHCRVVLRCWLWLREANSSILCEVEVDTETNTVVLYYDVGYDSERQPLTSRVMCWTWNREANTVVLRYVEYDREANYDESEWRDDERDAQV